MDTQSAKPLRYLQDTGLYPRLSKDEIEEANRFLEQLYLARLNEKFARFPADTEDARIPLEKAELMDILHFEYQRTVRLDSSVDIYFQRKKLMVRELIKTPKKEMD